MTMLFDLLSHRVLRPATRGAHEVRHRPVDFARERKNGHLPALLKQILAELKDNTGKLDRLVTSCTLLLDRQQR